MRIFRESLMSMAIRVSRTHRIPSPIPRYLHPDAGYGAKAQCSRIRTSRAGASPGLKARSGGSVERESRGAGYRLKSLAWMRSSAFCGAGSFRRSAVARFEMGLHARTQAGAATTTSGPRCRRGSVALIRSAGSVSRKGSMRRLPMSSTTSSQRTIVPICG